jgi:hypothetical protein
MYSGLSFTSNLLPVVIANTKFFFVTVPLQPALPQRLGRVRGELRSELEQCALLTTRARVQNKNFHDSGRWLPENSFVYWCVLGGYEFFGNQN